MSFLRNYSIATEGNECPTIYHTWCGLSTLSSLISRRVWIDQGFFTVYPNMYVLLVGNPGIKKTTGMKIARSMIREFPNIPIAPTAITKEAMTQYLAEEGSPCKKVFQWEGKKKEYSHLSIFANEIVSLLSLGGNPIGMIDFLTDIWDQDVFEVKTKNKGTDLVHGPYLTILGCMTPETTQNLLNQRIISGGFSRRCIFVFADKNNKPVSRPKVTEAQELAWKKCVERGKQLQLISGKFEWTPESMKFFDEWYDENFYKIEKTDDIVMQGFYRSKGEYVLKVAMLIALSEKDELVLHEADISASLAFIEQIEPHVSTVFSGTGRNELSPIGAAMLNLIQAQKGPVNIKRIYAAFWNQANYEEQNKILGFLKTQGKIDIKDLPEEKLTLVGTPDQFAAR